MRVYVFHAHNRVAYTFDQYSDIFDMRTTSQFVYFNGTSTCQCWIFVIVIIVAAFNIIIVSVVMMEAIFFKWKWSIVLLF